MKQALANALLWVLAKLWPLEDILGHAVKQAARSKVAREVAASTAALERAFLAEMDHASAKHAEMVALHQKRLAAVIEAPHLITPEGAAVLVATAANSATVIPQGGNSPAIAKAA